MIVVQRVMVIHLLYEVLNVSLVTKILNSTFSTYEKVKNLQIWQGNRNRK